MSPCKDGDAKILWCKCLLMGISWCECLLAGMPWCKCPIVDMSWCKCLDANIIYSKILFVFKIKASSTFEKYFQILICHFSKSHLLPFFLFMAPKKLVITVRNPQMGCWLKIKWSGLERFISTIWLRKWVARLKPFSRKNKFFENQAS